MRRPAPDHRHALGSPVHLGNRGHTTFGPPQAVRTPPTRGYTALHRGRLCYYWPVSFGGWFVTGRRLVVGGRGWWLSQCGRTPCGACGLVVFWWSAGLLLGVRRCLWVGRRGPTVGRLRLDGW